MKKLLCLLLSLVLLFSLCACGAEEPQTPSDEQTTTTTSTEETTSTTIEEDTTTTEGNTTTEGDTSSTEEESTTTTEESITTTFTTTIPVISKPTTTTTEASVVTTTTNTTTSKRPPVTTTTKKPVVTTQPTTTTKQTTTTTTTVVTTTTTEFVDNRPQIKILSIGHSFSVDAMKTYMWELFDAAGYNATIAYLYFPGCSLERHWHYISENRAKYHQYLKNTDGVWDGLYATNIDMKTNEVLSGGVRALDALWDEDWDIVTFQPSPDYGKGTMDYACKWGCNNNVNDYDHFAQLVQYVKDTLADPYNPNGPNTDVKFYYHLTWAFSEDCKLWSYMYSNFNQMQMYNDFINGTLQNITSKGIIPEANIIPCITSVQNARTSWMGDTFNEPADRGDGYHLNDKGDLVAAMTWVSYFTGKSAKDFSIGTKYSFAEYDAIAEAVDNAIANPLQVTQSSYKTAP